MVNEITIINLLNQISAISNRYKEIAEITGENFNIFKTLKVEAAEVRTHSPFLAELLNPKGSHGQKEIFLKLFTEQLQIKNFECENASIEVEKFIGVTSDDHTTGGRIDIIAIDRNNRAIIIENKIYAGDQENQLLRYYNFGIKNCKSFELLYLILEGKDATDWSKSGLKEDDFKKISYSINILPWLEKCKEKAVNHPILRETITQYINLIKYLTNQTINKKMEEEIVNKIINDKEYLTSFFEIYKNDVMVSVRKE